MRIALNKYFFIDEFVSPRIYELYKGNSIWFIDRPLIEVSFHLRNKFGPLIINNWYKGGSRDASGFRDRNCTVGADNSFHRQGKAIDIVPIDATVVEVKRYIEERQDIILALGITTMEENTTSWIHLDSRNTNKSKFLLKVSG